MMNQKKYSDVEKEVRRFFWKGVSDRDRAIFEGAITLGAIYHQFAGTPIVNREAVLTALENAIESTMSCQPYIEKVEIKIDRRKVESGTHPYDYGELSGKNTDIKVISRYGNTRVHFGIRFLPELNFPLAYIEKIEER